MIHHNRIVLFISVCVQLTGWIPKEIGNLKELTTLELQTGNQVRINTHASETCRERSMQFGVIHIECTLFGC